MNSCYLIGQLNEKATIVGVFKSSEPPWKMTRHSDTDYVLLCETTGSSYSEAHLEMNDFYRHYMPRLAERLPLP